MKKKQSFMQGVMILMLSQLIIKAVGLIYKVYLTNKEGFGDTGNAIFSSGFQVYAIFLAVTSIGVPNAISQLISSKVAVGDNKGAYRIFKIAISIFGFVGFVGTAIMFFSSKIIATTYLGIPEAEIIIIALAPSVFIVAISSVLRGYFNGKEKVSITAHSQSIEQIIKTILTIILVEIVAKVWANNTIVMVGMAAVVSTLSTFVSFIYLYIVYKKNKKEIWKDVITSKYQQKESIRTIIKNILYVSIPIAITSLLSTAHKSIDAVTIVNTISKFMPLEEAKFQYGILTGKVESLVVLPYSFNIAFSINLIPAIAASKARGEMESAIKRINFSMIATILISLPCMAVFGVFSEEILKLLFPNAFLGETMLSICSISIVFVALTQTIGGILQGLKRVKEMVIAIGIGAVVKLILNLVLLQIESLNIYGAIISTITSHIIIFIISLFYLKKYIPIKFNIIKFIVKPVLAALLMIYATMFTYKIGIFGVQSINFVISLLIGMAVYIISTIPLKILSKEEINMIPYINKLKK